MRQNASRELIGILVFLSDHKSLQGTALRRIPTGITGNRQCLFLPISLPCFYCSKFIVDDDVVEIVEVVS